MDLLRRARELYARGDLRDALEAAQAACERAPHDAEAWALLARVTRHCGLRQASDQAFARAASLSRRHPQPVRLSDDDFRGLVEQVRGELSPDARRRLESTEVRVAELPTEEEIRAGVKPEAVARRVRRPADVLTLYKVNLENQSGSRAALRGLLEKTLSRA